MESALIRDVDADDPSDVPFPSDLGIDFQLVIKMN
jgi:hypothetical protein